MRASPSSRILLYPLVSLAGPARVRLPPSAALMSNVYLKHRDEDGFLYICYSGENTFG